MKVLASVFSCEPGRGSEPGAGWNWVCEIARFHEVWAITLASNREAIEAAQVKRPLPNVHWIYFDLPRWARLWSEGKRGLFRCYYYLWQAGIYWMARKLHQEVKFDLIHHLTLGSYWMPSYLALLPAPFVWGPVGGGESEPSAFWFSFSAYGKLYEVARSLAQRVGHLDPFVRLPARRAAVALAKTSTTGNRIRALGSHRVIVFSEAGLSGEEIRSLGSLPPRVRGPLRLISLGRLLDWKGFELGLRAFAHFHVRFPGSEYWVVGEGPERKRLERLAEEMGLRDSVKFWGWIRRSEVPKMLAECDVLVHPSLHDSGGWVCLEAMAAGRPVICLDLGGPALQVTERTGIKVPAISPGQVVSDMAAALLKLASDPGWRLQLGAAGRERVQTHFRWDPKGEFLAQVYEELSGVKQPSPNLHSVHLHPPRQ